MPDSAGGHLEGAAPLSAAIAALRDELMHAFWAGQFAYDVNGQQRTLRFKPAPVELTLQVAVTWGHGRGRREVVVDKRGRRIFAPLNGNPNGETLAGATDVRRTRHPRGVLDRHR